MKTTLFLLYVLGWWNTVLFAQNLVVNPGFEEFSKGPVVTSNTMATYRVKGWELATAGTPDWYCTKLKERNVIADFSASLGKIEAHGGAAHAGFIGFSRNPMGGGNSEYLRGSLTAQLVKGRTYTVSFWVAHASKSDQKIDTLGVCLFADKFAMDTNTLQVTTQPQIRIAIDTSTKWTLVQGEFIADGTERYFFIGNFAVNFIRSGKYCGRPLQGWHNAYYYIDDVSITEKSSAAELTVVAGQKLTYNNILFETGKATLKSSSYAQLDQIVAALKKQSGLKVTISGHTDSDGDAKTNQTLSEQRAIAVKNYFISKGIDSTRITTQGFGSSQPVGSDKSKNRRVEFLFSE